MSKIQTYIPLSILHYYYVALYHSVISLLSLKSFIKEVIYNLGVYSEKLKFLSSSTVYKDNNEAMVVSKSSMMTLISKKISVKYHWFRQHVENESVIRKIESENQNADIFNKGLQDELFVSVIKLVCGW